MNRETLLDIAKSGVLAPSADNQHVFELELLDSAVRLWPNRAFASTTENHRIILGRISLGAVVENMQLRAGLLGLSTRSQWFLDGRTGPLAQLDFQPDSGLVADDLAMAIPTRHTNRRMYGGPKLTDGETTLINAAVKPVNGVRLIWLHKAARRRALGLIWRAESERFLRQRLHEEIFSSIRFDLSWSETADWAIPPGALEIEAPMRPLFKALRHWALMRPLTWVGAHHLIGLRAGWLPCWQAPALGLLTTSLPLGPGAVAVGAALERIWLQATQQGLAFQPLAASSVLALQTDADCGASSALRSALTSGWKSADPLGTPLMIFRMGRAAPPAITASRTGVDNYLAPAVSVSND